MLPRWFRALLAVEIGGAIALVVVGAHLVLGGGAPPGRVVDWAAGAPAGTPPAQPALPVVTPAPHPSAGGVAAIVPALLRRLNRDTEATAVGEYALVVQLESAIGEQISGIAIHPPGGG